MDGSNDHLTRGMTAGCWDCHAARLPWGRKRQGLQILQTRNTLRRNLAESPAKNPPCRNGLFRVHKLTGTADRMCSHCRLTVLQFSSAAHPKVHSFSCFSSVYRSFFASFFVDTVTRRLCEYICIFLILQNNLVATPNHPLLLPASALAKEATRYNVSDYIIQTGTRNLHVRSLTSSDTS